MTTLDKLKVVGWLWFGVGVSAIPAGIVFLLVPRLPTPPFSAPTFVFLAQHPTLVGLCELVMGALLVVVSLLFLRKHDWTRRVLQLISVFVCAVSAAWAVDWLRVVATLGGVDAPPFLVVWRVVMLLGGLCASVMALAPIAFCAWWLGRPAVAAEFHKSDPGS